MTDENAKIEKEAPPAPLTKRALDWTQRVWRPTGTVVAVGLALLLMWHVVNGKNGLTVWHQKRSEDQQLQKDIKRLKDENAHLQQHVEQLRSDPDAIEHEAREKLHYAKPNEVIVALPAAEKDQSLAGAGR
jgi:cell division protein FtsB